MTKTGNLAIGGKGSNVERRGSTALSLPLARTFRQERPPGRMDLTSLPQAATSSAVDGRLSSFDTLSHSILLANVVAAFPHPNPLPTRGEGDWRTGSAKSTGRRTACFEHSNIWILDLFRISRFEFRISASVVGR